MRLALALAAALAAAGPAAALPSKGPASQEESRAYLATREFYNQCLAVVSKKMPAEKLPFKPEAFSEKFLSAEEKKVVEKAQYMAIAAELYLTLPGQKA